MPDGSRLLVTGATGLLGAAVLERLLSHDRRMRVVALIRTPERWRPLAASLGAAASRVQPLVGDITREGLGLDASTRRALAGRVTRVIHLAADTSFSRTLAVSRAQNTEGTAHVLALADDCSAEQVVHVSTAFVAGTGTGFIADDTADARAWVNAYEQSKHEAEALVRAHRAAWTILRPSTIVCDDVDGRVTQFNAVHRALRLCHAGLASMLPGEEDTLVDVVTTHWVAEAIARCVARDDLHGRTLHLCAGERAMRLGEMIDRTWHRWSADADWRRRGIERPVLTDLDTYRLFEEAVRESADPRLARVVQALSHFVPQLALPKRFDTTGARALAASPAPIPEHFWGAMLDHLHAVAWHSTRRHVA